MRSLRRDKIGVYTGIVTRTYKVGAVGLRIDPDWLRPANAPNPLWGIPMTDANAVIVDGTVEIVYTYEGAESLSPDEEENTFTFHGGMEDKPIDAHPGLELLKTKFGWDSQLHTFPEFPPDEGSGGGFGAATTPKRNELFGTEGWRSVIGTYSRTFAAFSVSASVYHGIGTVFDSPPGLSRIGLVGKVGRRNWLKLAPEIRKRGNVAQITDNYELSGPRGWSRALYSINQLKESD